MAFHGIEQKLKHLACSVKRDSVHHEQTFQRTNLPVQHSEVPLHLLQPGMLAYLVSNWVSLIEPVGSSLKGLKTMNKKSIDQIWAPWRAHYIQNSTQESSISNRGCFLCNGLESSEDHENLLVWRRPKSAVFLNRYPYNNGHLLVAPLVHKGSLAELDGPDLLEPVETVKTSIMILDRLLKPTGYNVGLNLGQAAGAGLPGHLHWHIVPRWDGDTNFMPILSGTKVIVESLNAFYDRFIQEIAALN